ncbi:putative iron-regulated protein [Leeuwenhoekiella aestuarii]|uniref:Putative iron-regulated protein n=1 Tax=Leeuwenhoekiella aestuarii TaxID=2249426 RepID=A0A4Q0NX38_9FLAO|nr:ChaN family lipoprotein [Leeuwenhoekiella aestuarii]RXG15867.1 putative iron-regulated protein [Leeuwenhoekiella aestuarii]RXG16544.1 putative iron-regulated protein [Leeuwenhoekiella aestuarii]
MFKHLLLITISVFLPVSIFAQDKPAYTLFDASGNSVTYQTMLDSLQHKKDVILFGEMHDNPIAHWLELEVTKDLLETQKLTLGAEMIEADNQAQINAYLNDSIDLKQLDSTARLWINHKTDYQPLIDFAKTENLKFIATNVPRRYASMVYKQGFEALDSLSSEEKQWIAPLPITFDSQLPRYRKILKMMGDHGSPNLVMAQALKDATMAYYIIKNRKPDHVFIHYNGSYHSDFHEGILWYLQQAEPNLNYTTISSVSQKNLENLEEEYLNQADFIIVIDEDMTTTY